MGAGQMGMMITWRKGSALLRERTKRDEVSLRAFIHSLEKRPPWRADGTAIYLTGHAETAPSALLHNLKHNKVLHEQNIILTIETADQPHVEPLDRVEIEALSETFQDRKSTCLNSSHVSESRMPSSA